jgi:hypothetical protein
MRRKVLFAAALFLALGVIGLLGQQGRPVSSQDRGDQEGAVLTGVWYWQNNLDMYFVGAVLPSILTFHEDGTVSCSDALAFGGTPTNMNRYTPFYGVWERRGHHEFMATFLTLRFDTTLGNILVGVGRSRVKFEFTSDFDHFAGTMHLDFLPCPAGPYGFLMCPNPLLAKDTDWQPWSLTSPSDYSFKAARVSVVPY